MMLAPEVKSYLSAVGAAAMYVSVFRDAPVSVGVARDLDKALAGLRQFFQCDVVFGWIAWSQQLDAMSDIVRMPDVLLRQRADGVKVAKTLHEVVDGILFLAGCSQLVLTPHKTVVQRATALAGYVECLFEDLRTSGQMQAFNLAYKLHRAHMSRNGQSVIPYWKATEQLKRVTIKALIASPSRTISQIELLKAFHEEFPWFSNRTLDTSRKRA